MLLSLFDDLSFRQSCRRVFRKRRERVHDSIGPRTVSRHVRFGSSSLLSRSRRVHKAEVIGTQSVPCCEVLAGGEVRSYNGNLHFLEILGMGKPFAVQCAFSFSVNRSQSFGPNP